MRQVWSDPWPGSEEAPRRRGAASDQQSVEPGERITNVYMALETDPWWETKGTRLDTAKNTKLHSAFGFSTTPMVVGMGIPGTCVLKYRTPVALRFWAIG